jgi:hypothetical protein
MLDPNSDRIGFILTLMRAKTQGLPSWLEYTGRLQAAIPDQPLNIFGFYGFSRMGTVIPHGYKTRNHCCPVTVLASASNHRFI